MKTINNFLRVLFLIGLLFTSTELVALADKPDSAGVAQRSFEVGMYMSPQWKINLRVAIRRPERLVITVRNAKNIVLYREYVRRGSTGYWRKFDFEGSEPGVYQFEINDGQQSVVRRVEIVDIPTIDSQRYITYDQQLGQ
ncbi:hypothetical protein [Spirosoma areae]